MVICYVVWAGGICVLEFFDGCLGVGLCELVVYVVIYFRVVKMFLYWVAGLTVFVSGDVSVVFYERISFVCVDD